MKCELIKEIPNCWVPLLIGKKYIFYTDMEYIFHCISKDRLQQNWEIKNSYGGFLSDQHVVVELASHEILIVNIEDGTIVSKRKGVLNLPGKFHNEYYYNSYRFTDECMDTFVQFDLKTNQICRQQKTEFPVFLLLDYDSYLSQSNDKGSNYYYNIINKINIKYSSIIWEYHISDLGPYMDWDYLTPPVWKERRCYNMYYIDGIVYVSVSKGVVALDAETGKQLWWVDFNTTETSTLFYDIDSYYLSFADGKIYIRDWGEFVSIDMKTGEILLRKKYIGFKVGDEVVDNTMTSGIKIHNGKGYFVLDVQAELYLTSLDLKTGEVRIEAELPDVKDQVSAENIHFEGNRMYLQDNASFLYVYEVTE